MTSLYEDLTLTLQKRFLEKIGKPEEQFQNVSLLWFVYWHVKGDFPYQRKSPTARKKGKISHFFIFFEKKTEKVWDTKN